MTLITKNDQGEVINEQEIDYELVGTFFKNIVKMDEEELEKPEEEQMVTLVLKNERGEVVAETKVPKGEEKEMDHQEFDEVEEIPDNKGRRRTTVAIKKTKKKTTKVHKLRPTLIGAEYYTQIINDSIDKFGKRKATIKTFNEKGEVVDEKPVDLENLGDNYYNEIVEDVIDD